MENNNRLAALDIPDYYLEQWVQKSVSQPNSIHILEGLSGNKYVAGHYDIQRVKGLLGHGSIDPQMQFLGLSENELSQLKSIGEQGFVDIVFMSAPDCEIPAETQRLFARYKMDCLASTNPIVQIIVKSDSPKDVIDKVNAYSIAGLLHKPDADAFISKFRDILRFDFLPSELDAIREQAASRWKNSSPGFDSLLEYNEHIQRQQKEIDASRLVLADSGNDLKRAEYRRLQAKIATAEGYIYAAQQEIDQILHPVWVKIKSGLSPVSYSFMQLQDGTAITYGYDASVATSLINQPNIPSQKISAELPYIITPENFDALRENMSASSKQYAVYPIEIEQNNTIKQITSTKR